MYTHMHVFVCMFLMCLCCQTRLVLFCRFIFENSSLFSYLHNSKVEWQTFIWKPKILDYSKVVFSVLHAYSLLHVGNFVVWLLLVCPTLLKRMYLVINNNYTLRYFCKGRFFRLTLTLGLDNALQKESSLGTLL